MKKLEYNLNGELIKYIEYDKSGELERLHILEDKIYIKFFNDEKLLSIVKYKYPVYLQSFYLNNNYRFYPTLVGSNSLDMPEEEDRLEIENGEIDFFTIKDDVIEHWKNLLIS